MGQRFKVWRNQISRFSHGEAEFQKWLFVRVSGVLLGGKAGELLTLRNGSYGLSIDRQIRLVRRLSALWRYRYVVLSRRNISARVIVYDSSAVEKTLSEVPCSVLDQMGYRWGTGSRQFLEEVGRRWRRKEEIPHEIGLALGYPVKDVLGFIGLMSLRHSGMCGWRIYGDPAPSLMVRKRYEQARVKAEAFLGRDTRNGKSIDEHDNAVLRWMCMSSDYPDGISDVRKNERELPVQRKEEMALKEKDYPKNAEA